MINEGSIWHDSVKQFQVIKVVEQGGHTWVHYRTYNGPEVKEYSCYQESFIERFTQVVNQ